MGSRATRRSRALSVVAALACARSATGFSAARGWRPASAFRSFSSGDVVARRMSFVADGSDYAGGESDYESGGDDDGSRRRDDDDVGGADDDGDALAVEEEPVPLSKNAGARFLALVWDDRVDARGRDRVELHQARADRVTDHVMFCRKANLYNETFNYNSMADVFFSCPLLSSDLRSYVGHAMCIDSNTVEDARDLLRRDPMIRAVVGHDEDVADEDVDLSNVSLYRWRHMKDHTLRRDAGRDGVPAMIVGTHRDDHDAEDDAARDAAFDDHVRYLVSSDRVVFAGPLLALDDDDGDRVVGDLCVANVVDRDDAVRFAEDDPLARAGLYGDLRVHRYNDLDVTGKFQIQNLFRADDVKDVETEMREALEYWGYPVHDTQTKWNNR